uniref:DDHD domain-containing protein n=1 Tax=Acrobeloides nanus TaxID=290746 RepID=A0A914C020_9BILA
MLIKEYRILLPLSVEEYRVAQLYMIQKKSRLDSEGAGSGVEIITNRPYTDGPGGSGQYTYKIYHIADKIPTWIRAILPVSALQAHEEAWNAYPYTRTRYSCPLMDRFSVEVDTKYFNDPGTQENVFNLSEDELKNRVVDVMDFVKENVSSGDYSQEEDPKLYKSKKTGRGPLSDNWVEEYTQQGFPVMCAYKLCKVEFKYWGLQTRAERWIHDLALRGTMLRAHRQAWAWQDEWVGLTIQDIRRLEEDAALYLSKVMSNAQSVESVESDSSSDVFFDCYDFSPPHSHKPSLIRWSSELLIDRDENESPPLTPKPDPNASLLILVFHGDLYPESSPDSKMTDSNSLSSTLETLVMSHYPHLKNRVHVLRVTCGSELSSTVSSLNSICPSFGAHHPSLALLLTLNQSSFYEAVQGTINRANQIVNDFRNTDAGQSFTGEIFMVGDCIGGILMYEALIKPVNGHVPVSRNSSSISTQSKPTIPEGKEEDPSAWSVHDFPHLSDQNSPHFLNSEPSLFNNGHGQNGHIFHYNGPNKQYIRNLSAPPSATSIRKKFSTASMQSNDTLEMSSNNSTPSTLNFRPSSAFLLGCPLALVLMQRKLIGRDVDPLDCNQIFNLYYSLDPCGSRLEPVLNPQLAMLNPLPVPKYQRFPLGDGRHMSFDNALEASLLWGSRRIDHQLYCPTEMVALPSAALPNILHASYWESKDVGSFILRQFVRADESQTFAAFSTSAAATTPFKIEMPSLHWSRRRTRFKIANLSANHRANDIIVPEGSDQIIHARFCYGPMDLVALSREEILIFVCPFGGEWYQTGSEMTDTHGRLTVNLGKRLAIGIHKIKMIVAGDHSFLDMFITVVPPETRCVVFSIDGSLTGSVSVTGRDPRVRPGAVDVVRYWQQQGYLILYVTARPDMQQRVVGSWLAQHNFPHGLLFFTPSLSTDPLRQKTQYLRHLVDLGIKVQAAYGSTAGIDSDRIFSVAGGKRRGCVSLEDGYSQHLHDLHAGRLQVAQPVVHSQLILDNSYFTTLNKQHSRSFVQRTHSFTPRSGKYHEPVHKKCSQLSIAAK